MDLKIDRNIIGMPKMPPKTLRRDDSQPSPRDGKMTPEYRETQQGHGWTLECCIFLDYLNTVKLKYVSTRQERTRFHSHHVLRWKDEKNPGNMSIHDDFKKATRSLAKVKHQEGPRSRIRKKPIDEQLRSQLRW